MDLCAPLCDVAGTGAQAHRTATLIAPQGQDCQPAFHALNPSEVCWTWWSHGGLQFSSFWVIQKDQGERSEGVACGLMRQGHLVEGHHNVSHILEVPRMFRWQWALAGMPSHGRQQMCTSISMASIFFFHYTLTESLAAKRSRSKGHHQCGPSE